MSRTNIESGNNGVVVTQKPIVDPSVILSDTPAKPRKTKVTTKAVSINDVPSGDRKELVDHEVPSTETTGEVSDRSAKGSGVDSKGVDPVGVEVDTRETVAAEEVQEVSSPSAGKPEKFAIDLTANRLIELLRGQANAKFFHDQHGIAFAWIPTVGTPQHFECHPIRSRAFRARVIEFAETYSVNQPPAKVINDAIETTKLLTFKEPTRKLANRHKSRRDRITIDLGDPDWKAVDVTTDGWKLSNQSEAMFFRPQHLQALPVPEDGGDPFELFEYVPVDSEDEKLLILSWVVSAMNPDVQSPILIFSGIQGSLKTTRSRRLRSLTDPSVTPVLGDIELSNLFLTFQHHAVPCFENVSKFSKRMADMFCRAVTGFGIEKRKLFTDSDQVLYSFRRPIIINGIDIPSTQPDFLDRCIVINCRRVESFRPLKELDEAFEKAKPRLFGSLLGLLAKTLTLLPETSSSGEFRMADFAHFGRALTVAVGRSPEEFDKAYGANIRHQGKEILDASPMTNAVISFASKHTSSQPWEGSAQDLLARLRETAHKNGDRDAMSDLPKNARWLSSRLSEMMTALCADGVIVDRLPRTSASRGWKVSMTDGARVERERRLNQSDAVDKALAEADLFEIMGGEDSNDQS